MATVTEFFEAPSGDFHGGCTKEQLMRIAGHYAIVDKKREGEIKDIVLTALQEKGVYGKGEPECLSGSELTFGQRKELMALQLEQGKLKNEAERMKIEFEDV